MNDWRSEAHDRMFPECDKPLPHGHDLGVIAARRYDEPLVAFEGQQGLGGCLRGAALLLGAVVVALGMWAAIFFVVVLAVPA